MQFPKIICPNSKDSSYYMKQKTIKKHQQLRTKSKSDDNQCWISLTQYLSFNLFQPIWKIYLIIFRRIEIVKFEIELIVLLNMILARCLVKNLPPLIISRRNWEGPIWFAYKCVFLKPAGHLSGWYAGAAHTGSGKLIESIYFHLW